MKYRPDVLYVGIGIQIVGVILFAAVWVLDSLSRKKRLAAGEEIFTPVDINAPEVCLPDETAFETAEASEENEEAPADAPYGETTEENEGDNT